ncbi:haloacid dehalogenase type II [Streptomyces sp. NPDC048109]|uniref:haloacid dehalogenase type II n=1 Tax=Streptomyces TaxID=1883 RepID=UPI0033D20DCC
MPRQNAPLLVFDVNETLSDMNPLQDRFADIGAPPHLFPLWFASVLRDGFALTAAGSFAPFSDVAREALRALLSSAPGWSGDAEQAADSVLDGLSRLEVHPDVPDGIRALHESGFRLVTMTNGSSHLSEQLLGRAGLKDCFESHLDVSGPQRWKPARAAYQYVVEQAGVRPDEAVLVAVHPWDIDGAQRAGLGGAWLRRKAAEYPKVMLSPTYTVDNLTELADALA